MTALQAVQQRAKQTIAIWGGAYMYRISVILASVVAAASAPAHAAITFHIATTYDEGAANPGYATDFPVSVDATFTLNYFYRYNNENDSALQFSGTVSSFLIGGVEQDAASFFVHGAEVASSDPNNSEVNFVVDNGNNTYFTSVFFAALPTPAVVPTDPDFYQSVARLGWLNRPHIFAFSNNWSHPYTVEVSGSMDDVVIITPPSFVPEPASWVLMLGGFGLVGGSLRGRRENQHALA